MELDFFVATYPRIYHMAEADTWESIQQHGLLSTTAILDTLGISGADRALYEVLHRPETTTIPLDAVNGIVLRDQKPMPPNRLNKCLLNGITPNQWYENLNGRVFFWATEERLLRLLNARAYRNKIHDVLTVDTASLVTDYGDVMELCHMNSGNTLPFPSPRDLSIFQRIHQYPTRRDGKPLKAVVEVTIPYSVPNLSNFVLEVKRMQGASTISNLFTRRMTR